MNERTRQTIRPRQCTICRHTNRVLIELARANGASLSAVAAKFGVKRSSVFRHFEKHVTRDRYSELLAGPAKVQGLANMAAEESGTLLQQLQIVRSVLLRQFLGAAEVGDRSGVATVAGRLLESLRELGRLTGELRELSGINITNNVMNLVASPQYAHLQEGLLNVARAHPEARAAIVAVLRGLDDSPAPMTNGAHPPLIEASANAP